MKWTLTLGIVPGYENTKTEINLDEIVRELKEYFKQTTALLEITPCEIVYYK